TQWSKMVVMTEMRSVK
ncbi:hypothetical protein C359_02979, partial [Cryptococcus neoformans Bt120]